MNNRHSVNKQRMIDAVLTSPGDTAPILRRAVEQWAAELGSRPSAKESSPPIYRGEVPPELAVYVKKVALHAYKVTDEDIEALRKAGISEDAIFEITLSAALGAGMARLERGLAALTGDR